MVKNKLNKKKASKKEIRELREMVIEIQRDPTTMMQIRKLIAQTS